MDQHPEIDWTLTTWEGSRRVQLRRWRRLTLRERLQAVEDMAELARRFQELRQAGKFHSPMTKGGKDQGRR